MPVLESKAVIPHDPNMGVGPLDNVAGAVQLVEAFERAKNSLLRPQDIMVIASKAGPRTYVKR